MEIGVTKAVQDKIKSKLAVITKDVAFSFFNSSGVSG